MNKKVFLCILFFTFLNQTNSFADYPTWLEKEFKISKSLLLENISPQDTLPGTVVASPSRSEPNYFFHWVRDAGLVMNSVWRIYKAEKNQNLKKKLIKELENFYELTRLHQASNAPAGLGEVKFNVDGTPFTGPWGRPQNDGPALRASALINLAEYYLSKNNFEKALEVFNKTIIKDLNYVVQNWQNDDFDLWEEVKGTHFFTRMVQQRALINGSILAEKLSQGIHSSIYRHEASLILSELEWHWDDQWGIFHSTLNRTAGIDYKDGMDSSIILAAIYTAQLDDFGSFSITDRRFMSSLNIMDKKFNEIYKINKSYPELGTAIGRYPEDQYDGLKTGSFGNPWFLNTAGFANYCFQLVSNYKKLKEIRIGRNNIHFFENILKNKQSILKEGVTIFPSDKLYKEILDSLISKGDSYLKRMKFHMSNDGRMSEQMNRNNGYMQGARDLTWSYSSFVDAYLSREKALK